MNSLPPIPIPPSRLWREFRCRVLPALIFVGALTTIIVLWRQVVHSPSWPGPAAAGLAVQSGQTLPENMAQAYPYRTKGLAHHSSHHNLRGLPQENNRSGTTFTYGTSLIEASAPLPLGSRSSSNLFPGEALDPKNGSNRN